MGLFDEDEPVRRRRGHDEDKAIKTLLSSSKVWRAQQRVISVQSRAPQRSSRVGSVAGHPTRSYHFRVEAAKTPGKLARYVHRIDGDRDEELESKGGIEPDEFEHRAQNTERSIAEAGVTKRAAVYNLTIELPYQNMMGATAEECTRVRTAMAERIANMWGGRCTWAVHKSNDKGEEKPHIHLLILAGPQGERPIEGREAMMAVRKNVAETINEAAREMTGRRLAVEFNGGTLKDTGIKRPAKQRIATGVYRARERAQAMESTGRTAPQRLAKLAAAANRIDAAWQRACEDGTEIPPTGWRKAKRDLERAEAQKAEAEAALASAPAVAPPPSSPVRPPSIAYEPPPVPASCKEIKTVEVPIAGMLGTKIHPAKVEVDHSQVFLASDQAGFQRGADLSTAAWKGVAQAAEDDAAWANRRLLDLGQENIELRRLADPKKREDDLEKARKDAAAKERASILDSTRKAAETKRRNEISEEMRSEERNAARKEFQAEIEAARQSAAIARQELSELKAKPPEVRTVVKTVVKEVTKEVIPADIAEIYSAIDTIKITMRGVSPQLEAMPPAKAVRTLAMGIPKLLDALDKAQREAAELAKALEAAHPPPPPTPAPAPEKPAPMPPRSPRGRGGIGE